MFGKEPGSRCTGSILSNFLNFPNFLFWLRLASGKACLHPGVATRVSHLV